MPRCNGTHDIIVGETRISGKESAEKALAAARKKIHHNIRAIGHDKCPKDADCDDEYDEETKKSYKTRCTPTVPKKVIDAFVKDLEDSIDEYRDSDGDTSFAVTIPQHTWTITCKCNRMGKSHQ